MSSGTLAVPDFNESREQVRACEECGFHGTVTVTLTDGRWEEWDCPRCSHHHDEELVDEDDPDWWHDHLREDC